MKSGSIFLILLVVIISCSPVPRPKDLAKGIHMVHKEAMLKLTAIIQYHPQASMIVTKVAKLYEETIQKMVKLGEIRAQMSKNDQKRVTDFVSRLMNKKHPTSPLAWSFSVMTRAQDYYGQKARYKLTSLITSFAILSQYSQLDIIKNQLPKEAKRLGIR